MTGAPEPTKLGPQLPGWSQVCTYNPDAPLWREEHACKAPLAYHVAVKATEEPSGVAFVGCCVEHYLSEFRESVRADDFLDVHEAGLWCGLPGSWYVWSWTEEPGRCAVDDSGEERHAAGRVPLAATPDA